MLAPVLVTLMRWMPKVVHMLDDLSNELQRVTEKGLLVLPNSGLGFAAVFVQSAGI